MADEPPPAARCHALVAAAGSGSRAQSALPKQYVQLDGRPMLAHSLAALAQVARIDRVLVVVAPEDDGAFQRHLGAAVASRVSVVACGGATRASSVAAGVAELASRGASASDWVLVHDAARCLVRPEWIEALIDACWSDPVGGLLAVPVADTLKREVEGRSRATIPRAGIWQAQTPQMFRLGMLAEALARGDADATDEAGAIERLGMAPRLVFGSAENLKVTHAGDFALAEAILRRRHASHEAPTLAPLAVPQGGASVPSGGRATG